MIEKFPTLQQIVILASYLLLFRLIYDLFLGTIGNDLTSYLMIGYMILIAIHWFPNPVSVFERWILNNQKDGN
jgi:hypothetical protein